MFEWRTNLQMQGRFLTTGARDVERSHTLLLYVQLSGRLNYPDYFNYLQTSTVLTCQLSTLAMVP